MEQKLSIRKKNYLNNRDLLKEIHKSKNSYCYYLDESDQDYDIILNNLDRINRNTISQAKKNRAERLARRAWEESLQNGEITRLDEFSIDHRKIEKTDLVFRIHTFDHIPEAPGRKKNPKNIQDFHVKINFPPFQHYKLDENDQPYCVGKSHWQGGLENGYFNLDHGQMTNKLAHMFIKLCERYGSKWNWRGYTYNDEMRGQALMQLSQVGLQFDESKSQNPFAYYTATITNCFTRILLQEKKNQSIRDDLLEINGYNPSSTRQFENHQTWLNETSDKK